MALGDIDRHFAWQGWHLWHWTGSGGALGLQWPPVVAAAVGVTGVALGNIDRHFAWQAWHRLALTPSLTHLFVTYHLSHTIFHTPSFTQSLFAEGVALAALDWLSHHL